jgi:TonB family protein
LLESLPDRPPPPPEAWNVATPAESVRITNMGEVFNEANYPFWAEKQAIEGHVRFRVAVDASGRALGCEVIESSKAPALDRPTCDLLMAQARFAPALDQRGRAIPGIFSRQVRWVLANRAPHPVVNSSERAIITIDGQGRKQCRVEASPGAEVDPRTCQAYLLSPFLDMTLAQILLERAGERDRWELVYHEGRLIPGGPAGEGATIGEGPGEQLIHRGRMRLTIDAAGKVTGCTPIERGRVPDEEWKAGCASMGQDEWQAGAGERTLVTVGATYLRERRGTTVP